MENNRSFKSALMCALGFHEYEENGQDVVKNAYGIELGKVYISKCKHCGKIKAKTVKTIEY